MAPRNRIHLPSATLCVISPVILTLKLQPILAIMPDHSAVRTQEVGGILSPQPLLGLADVLGHDAIKGESAPAFSPARQLEHPERVVHFGTLSAFEILHAWISLDPVPNRNSRHFVFSSALGMLTIRSSLAMSA